MTTPSTHFKRTSAQMFMCMCIGYSGSIVEYFSDKNCHKNLPHRSFHFCWAQSNHSYRFQGWLSNVYSSMQTVMTTSNIIIMLNRNYCRNHFLATYTNEPKTRKARSTSYVSNITLQYWIYLFLWTETHIQWGSIQYKTVHSCQQRYLLSSL
jgi:hypothetical protein